MIVGAAQVRLRLPEHVLSLKEKRHIVRSLLDRTRAKFGVAAAEVESNELWQIADLGFACVSNSEAHARDILEHVTNHLQALRPDITILEVVEDVTSLP